jgi:hypothetical protein
LASKRAAEISAAADLLGRVGVTVAQFDAEALSKPRRLPELLAEMNIPMEIEEATLTDYQEAERRACLHLPPSLPDTKSDEMRDLVIWAVALRIARRRNGALLVSVDKVHSGELGTSEAAAVGLLRAETLDKALELLGRESPALQLAKQLLAVVWNSMRQSSLPLGDEPSLQKIANVAFSYDSDGRASGALTFVTRGNGGVLSAHASIRQLNKNIVGLDLTSITLGGATWKTGSLSTQVEGTLPIVAPAETENLRELRELLR